MSKKGGEGEKMCGFLRVTVHQTQQHTQLGAPPAQAPPSITTQWLPPKPTIEVLSYRIYYICSRACWDEGYL